MPAVVDPEFAAWLKRGRQLFALLPVPDLSDISCATTCGSSEIEQFLCGRQWDALALADAFEGRRNDSIDLGEIPTRLSRAGLRYYFPGLLLHFLRNGTYQHSNWGGTFYFNFVRRIQFDDHLVLNCGGPDSYFDFTSDQKAFCGRILIEIYDKYGDIYEPVIGRGFEWQDVARCSVKRALDNYWSKWV